MNKEYIPCEEAALSARTTKQKNKQQKIELFNDSFQNYKRYQIPKAQLVIAAIPYNLAENAYASSPQWYVDGDNKNGVNNGIYI